MSPGLFQIAVILGLVVLLFGSRHLGKLGWQLGRLFRTVRGGQGDALQTVQNARRLAKFSRGGFPWLK